MIGSAHVGQRRLLALAGEFGWETTHAAIEAVLDGAERQARAVIATWKDGVYRGEAFLDDDGHGYTDIHVRATVTKRGSDLIIDLSDSHEQVVGFVNSSYPEHAVGGGGGAGLSDRSAHAEERRRVPAGGGDRQARHGGVGERGRAGDAVHQPLLAGDHRGDHQGAGARLSGSRRWRDGAGGSASPSRGAIRARRSRSSGTCSRRGPAAARRRWAMAGRRRRVAGGRRHQVRQPGGDRGAVPAVLPHARVPAGVRRRRAVSRRRLAACSRWWRRSTSRRAATPPATA